MSRRQVLALLGLGAAVVVTGVLALVLRDGGRTEVSADAATTSTTADDGTTTSTRPRRTTTSTSSTLAPAPTSSSTTSTEAPRAAPAPTTTAATTATTVAACEPSSDGFGTISCVTAADLGSSWRPGCPVAPQGLRALDVPHWGYDGEVHHGRVIVAADEARAVRAALRAVYDARFPIQQMRPVQHYGSDDGASMRANNTSAFNCRTVAGTDRWSEHSFGKAIDINPLHNPYVKGSTVDPPEGARWADRSLDEPGMIKDGDAVVRAFEAQGWHWGGYWSSGQDYQHFSRSGR